MNIQNYWTIDDASEMCYVPKAAFFRMDNEGVLKLVVNDRKLYVNREALRRVIDAAEDCPTLLYCTCVTGPCEC